MELTIRPATMPDAAALTGIAHEAKRHWEYPEAWMTLWREALTITPDYIAGHEMAVAEIGDEIVGFYALAGNGDRWELDHLWLRPAWIGRGFGRALFTHAVERLEELAPGATLEIEADPNAEEFYLRMGARRVGETVHDWNGVRRTLPLLELGQRETPPDPLFRKEGEPEEKSVDSLESYFLRTERLGFRSWRDEDLELARGLWGDPEVTRLIDARGTLGEEQIRERLAGEIAVEREHGVQYWPIFTLAGGEHVGCCGLRPYDPAGRIFELGVHLRSDRWRHGFAAEAALAVIGHAFEALDAAGLFAGHNPNNHGSRRLLEKLGFRYTHDEFYPPTGLRHPSYILTRETT